MLKLTGCGLLICVSFLMGRLHKAKQIRICETLKRLYDLFSDVLYAIDHSSETMVQTVTRCAHMERFKDLAFLKSGLQEMVQGVCLSEAIHDAFLSDARCRQLNADERSICADVLVQLGTTAKDAQIKRLSEAGAMLECALRRRQEDPRMTGSYYEWMYTLAGVCAVLLLV